LTSTMSLNKNVIALKLLDMHKQRQTMTDCSQVKELWSVSM